MTFTRESREALRQAYNDARERKADSFKFQDSEILVGYAKYLLEYLDSLMHA